MGVFAPHALQVLRRHGVNRPRDLPPDARAELEEMSKTLWPQHAEGRANVAQFERADELPLSFFTEVSGSA